MFDITGKLAKFLFFSPSVFFAAFFLVASAGFSRQLMEAGVLFFGNTGCRILMLFILCGSVIVFVVSQALVLFKSRRLRGFNALKAAGMIAVLFLAVFFISKEELVQVRMHFLFYAVLSWIACRDAETKAGPWQGILASLFFASLAGILEELFQKILPYRVFEISDIIYNIEGAVLGVVLYILRIR